MLMPRAGRTSPSPRTLAGCMNILPLTSPQQSYKPCGRQKVRLSGPPPVPASCSDGHCRPCV